MTACLRGGAVQVIRTKKHAVTAIKLMSILLTQNRIKWARRKLKFLVPGIHDTTPIYAISAQRPNTLSASEWQKIATVVTQEH